MTAYLPNKENDGAGAERTRSAGAPRIVSAVGVLYRELLQRGDIGRATDDSCK